MLINCNSLNESSILSGMYHIDSSSRLERWIHLLKTIVLSFYSILMTIRLVFLFVVFPLICILVLFSIHKDKEKSPYFAIISLSIIMLVYFYVSDGLFATNVEIVDTAGNLAAMLMTVFMSIVVVVHCRCHCYCLIIIVHHCHPSPLSLSSSLSTVQ